MTEWASSPWASTADTPRLSPAPPAFARTSSSHLPLDSGYFGTFAEEAVWGEATTPGAGANGAEKTTYNVELKSPRPIASPGRIANGKGNRWLRPSASWGDAAADASEDATEPFEEANNTTHAVDPIACASPLADTIVLTDVGHKSITDNDASASYIDDPSDLIHDGLGIIVGDASAPYGTADERQHPAASPIMRSLSPIKDNVAAVSPAPSLPIELHAGADFTGPDIEVATNVTTHPGTQQARLASLKFPIDLGIISTIFPPITADGDPPLLDTIITTSSERKTQYRITRPYSMRQYNIGDFENYKRVTWHDSAVHDEVIDIVGNWIAKDRATGGGMFSVPSNKRASGFGWGSDDKRDSGDVAASPSSIMLPKITGPTGFGWSTSTMTPLQPSRAGEDNLHGAPRAFDEMRRMQPKARRTPIRKPRIVSVKSLDSPQAPDENIVSVLDELDLFEKAVVSEATQPENGLTATVAGHGHRRGLSATSFDNEFGIFEEATGEDADFEDFSIAPPPIAITPPPHKEMVQSDCDHDNVAEVRVQDVEPLESQDLQAYHMKESDDATERIDADATVVLNLASPEKEDEAFFKDGGDEFDDFDAFESAPSFEYTDTPHKTLDAVEDVQSLEYTDTPEHDLSSMQPEIVATNTGSETLGPSSHPSMAGEENHGQQINEEISSDATKVEPDGFDSSDAMPLSGSAIHDHKPHVSIASPLLLPRVTLDPRNDQSSDLPMNVLESIPGSELLTAMPKQATMAFDDFSIFDTPVSHEPAPGLGVRPNTVKEVQPVVLTPITAPSINALNLNDEDAEDDFGAFEEADSPVAPAKSRPETVAPASSVAAPIFNDFSGLEDDLFFRSQAALPTRPNTAPIIPPSLVQSTTSTSSTRPTSLFAIPTTIITNVVPKTQIQADSLIPSRSTSSPRKPSPITSSPEAPNQSPITTKLPAPPSKAPKPNTSRSAQPMKKLPIPIDHGASILGALAFLDAEEDAAAGAQEIDFGSWDDDVDDDELREREALASEREIARLRRGEWVGEKPDIAKEMERKELERKNEEEDVVRRVVVGLPDWRYML